MGWSSSGDIVSHPVFPVLSVPSSYLQCTAGIRELLEVAKSSVPTSIWTVTPVVLKATAGLRLLPGEKAKHLLDRVRDTLTTSSLFPVYCPQRSSHLKHVLKGQRTVPDLIVPIRGVMSSSHLHLQPEISIDGVWIISML